MQELQFRITEKGVEKDVSGSEFRKIATNCGIKTSDNFVSFYDPETETGGYVTRWHPAFGC